MPGSGGNREGRGWWNKGAPQHGHVKRHSKESKDSPLRRRVREPLKVENDVQQLNQAQCASRIGEHWRRPSSRLRDWIAERPLKPLVVEVEESIPDAKRSPSPTQKLATTQRTSKVSEEKKGSKEKREDEEDNQPQSESPQVTASWGMRRIQTEVHEDESLWSSTPSEIIGKPGRRITDLEVEVEENEDHSAQKSASMNSLKKNLRARIAERASLSLPDQVTGMKKKKSKKVSMYDKDKDADGLSVMPMIRPSIAESVVDEECDIDEDPSKDTGMRTTTNEMSQIQMRHTTPRKSSTIPLPPVQQQQDQNHTTAPGKVGPNAKYWEWLLRASSMLAYGDQKTARLTGSKTDWNRSSTSSSDTVDANVSPTGPVANQEVSPPNSRITWGEPTICSENEDHSGTASAKTVPRLLRLTREEQTKTKLEEPVEEEKPAEEEAEVDKIPEEAETGRSKSKEKKLANRDFQLTMLRHEAQERAQEEKQRKKMQEEEEQFPESPSQGLNGRKSTIDGRLSISTPSNIAKELNVPVEDVKSAKKFFDQFDVNSTGLLDKEQFKQMIAALAGHESIDDLSEETVDSSWAECDKDNSEYVDFMEFSQWYSAHGFLEDLLLTPSQRHIREVARKFELAFSEVEHVKMMFDRFDDDGSGQLEFGEFKVLLYRLMKIPQHLEMPQSRVRQFWTEIDLDGSGEVDFEEFLQWYMRYFDLAGGGQLISPIEHFYKSVRPLLPENSRKTIVPGGDTGRFARTI